MMRWRGVELKDLEDHALLDALRQTFKICGALWQEVQRRRLMRRL